MGKQVDQGTRWESRIVKTAQAHGRKAERMAKRGIKGEPDVRIVAEPFRLPTMIGDLHYLPVVFWENWVKRNKRRRAVRMVTLLESDYWKLLDNQKDDRYGFLVQAKSTEVLGVRAVLERLIEAIEEGNYA